MENENKSTLSEKTRKMLPFIYMVLTVIGAFLIMGWDFIYVLSGYQLLAYWINIWFIFTGIFQILSLISMILLLIVSIWGWAYAAGKAKELKIGSWGLKTIAEFMFIVFCLCSIDTLARVVTNALAWGVIVPLARVLSPVFVSRFRRIKQANRSESEDGTHIVRR